MLDLISELERSFGIPLELSRILIDKGIKNLDLAEATFNPVLENLQPPSTLPDLIPSVERILRAVGKGESILVFGHEDADGITSTAIILRTLEFLGISANHYIPSKRNEAYGLSISAIDYIVERYKPSLIVTVDSGSTSVEGVEYCKEKGIDVIITDHHELKETIPDTLLVNPKRGGDSFPYLAGCGVALKVAWELISLRAGWNLNKIFEELPELFIFAAIGTVADRVPLFSENRIIYGAGKKALEWYRPNFVKAFENIRKQSGNQTDRATIEDLISIVSAGKSNNGENKGVLLLLSKDVATAEELIKPIWSAVNEWQQKAQYYLEEAKSSLKMVRDYIVVDLKDAEPQYLGYVAGQLKDSFNVPTIVLGRREDGIVVAEVRAPYGFNSLEMLNYLSDLFIDYGGHKPASGFSMYERDIPELYELLVQYFKNNPFEGGEISRDIEYHYVDPDFIKNLDRLGKVGVEIRVLFSNVEIGKLREVLSSYSVIDPENLLDLYSGDKKVSVLIVSTISGFKVEKLVPSN
ncbi:MAG: DHH family phosphoesterase [candidate division WOR-3 bacterium]